MLYSLETEKIQSFTLTHVVAPAIFSTWSARVDKVSDLTIEDTTTS